MKFKIVLQMLLCVVANNIANALTSEEIVEVREVCCAAGETFAGAAGAAGCSAAEPPGDVEPEQRDTCRAELRSCCQKHFRHKEACSAGMELAPQRRCSVPRSDVGKTCCEECSFGRWTGESQGREACGEPAGGDVSPATALRKNAYYHCCLDAADNPETTTEAKIETTTAKRVTTTRKPRQTCKTKPCDHLCNDEGGTVTCQCRDGFRLQPDKRSCKDINECAEASDDLCTAAGTVCHNTPGKFKCVPIRKRDVGLTCPPGFKRNVVNQVCDDINECQLPRPPCPKYVCENTIGGYKCAGKPGKPFEEAPGPGPGPGPGDGTGPRATPEPAASTPAPARNDICPPGFRAGPDDECLDIDECDERLDDCQRLSQHCINTHGSFFCQDHVSKRCAPGFKVNDATGICEDIDECEESTEVCRRNEVCVNMPGAYTCKSKISTLPKLATKTCQEGTRLRPGGSICEDIDECREGTHLCDQFQNCINTFAGHECRCKSGYELDSSASCVDIDECALKLDNCGPGTHCLNSLGSFSCSRQQRPRPPGTTTPGPPNYDYEYYDSEEDNSTINETNPDPVPYRPTASTSSARPRPTPPRPTAVPRPPTPTPRPTTPTPRPTTHSPRQTIATPRPSTTITTSTTPAPPPLPPRPQYDPQPRTTSTSRRPYTSRPQSRPTRPPPSPTTTRRPEVPVTPRRPPSRRPEPEPPVEVALPTPKDPVTIERDLGAGLDTSDIPKDRWTNVVGKERTERPENEFDPNLLHCLNGFERNELGECVDTDECEGAHICSSLEVCVNLPGGYKCDCVAGFRRDVGGWCVSETPPTSSTTTPSPNTTEPTTTAEPPSPPERRRPSHTPTSRPRPYAPPTNCELGYKFDSGQDKCVDIDECGTNKANCSPQEECVNVAGGYRCECGRRCRPPAAPTDPAYVAPGGGADAGAGDVCQNTRGGYHCHRITCPHGYKLESKHRCSRVQRSCPVSDWACIHQPSSYSYNFITFVANIYLPEGSVDLFTMHGPAWRDSVVDFELRMVDVQASPGVQPAHISCFDMRPTNNVCRIALLCSLGGPQVAEMELTMSLYQRGQFAGSAVARLVVIVSQYEF